MKEGEEMGEKLLLEKDKEEKDDFIIDYRKKLDKIKNFEIIEKIIIEFPSDILKGCNIIDVH
jgi:hypothetical protein